MEDRVIVEVNDCKYEVDRYCPHQLADMKENWIVDGHFLICPRHCWKFDLEKGGQCTDNEESIYAKKIAD